MDIHYGLSLIYSYLLPLIDIHETSTGFKFAFKYGLFKGLTCIFNEDRLETTCNIPSVLNLIDVSNILGLSKSNIFRELCKFIGVDDCFAGKITLIYHPSYKKHIFYSVYLSRNTDYYTNTIKWTRQAIEKGFVDSSSYIPRQFNLYKKRIDCILEECMDPFQEVISLLEIPGVGLKSLNAYLLHAYGYTYYAPLDRHYAGFLGLKPLSINKKRCVVYSLNCLRCGDIKCPYYVAINKLGLYNGVVQSVVYVYNRLKSLRRSMLEQILVQNRSLYLDMLKKVLDEVITKVKSTI